jgi:hypothetical protein
MTTTPEALRRVEEAAAACAARMKQAPAGVPVAPPPELDTLLAAIRDLGPQYAFERDGRPEAIAAVRLALPPVERDLLDAIVDDHACEVAALREALLQIALTHGGRDRQ